MAEIAHHLSRNLTEQKKLTETDPLLHRAEQICKWKNGATQRRWALVEADQLARQSAETGK